MSTPVAFPTSLDFPDGSYYPFPGGHSITSPATILGSAYHSQWRADDPFRVMAGSKVAALYNYGLDASDMLQGTDANRPLYGATSFNGGPGVTFDGVDDFMQANFNTPVSGSARPYVWMVYQLTDTAEVYNLSNLSSAGSEFLHCFYSTGYPAVGLARFDTGGSQVFSGGAGNDTNRHLCEYGYTAGGLNSIVTDGAGADSSRTVAPGAAQTFFRLCQDPAGVQSAKCTVCTIIVSSTEPDASTKAAMRTYLRGANFANYPGSSLGLP